MWLKFYIDLQDDGFVLDICGEDGVTGDIDGDRRQRQLIASGSYSGADVTCHVIMLTWHAGLLPWLLLRAILQDCRQLLPEHSFLLAYVQQLIVQEPANCPFQIPVRLNIPCTATCVTSRFAHLSVDDSNWVSQLSTRMTARTATRRLCQVAAAAGTACLAGPLFVTDDQPLAPPTQASSGALPAAEVRICSQVFGC